MTKHYYIPLPWMILIPYRLISGIWRLISFRTSLSKRDRSVLRWLSLPDHPIRPRDRQVRNFRELEHAIKTGQPVTFSYLNSSKEESRRKIFPKRLFRRKQIVYCQAFDTCHEEYRVFRLDRMGDLKIARYGEVKAGGLKD
jgi:predicted DNA-binding transcriptional regulator YafY